MAPNPECLAVWCGILQVLNLWTRTTGDKSISVLRGSSVELPCDIPAANDVSRLYVVWSVTPANDGGPPRQVILFQDGVVITSPWGTGSRARFADHPTRSGSVGIERVQQEDAGLYQCVAINPASAHHSRIQTITLHVLDAPTHPNCAMEGEEVLGGSVILTCDSSTGNPAPMYSWWRVDSNRNQMLNSSHTSQGTLIIQNLSVDSSGVYLCIASNDLGSDRCSVELILKIFQESVHGMATAIGITLTMGVIIVTLFGIILWLHSRNKEPRSGFWAAALQMLPDLQTSRCEAKQQRDHGPYTDYRGGGVC
ncbi:immunoglobulin superfamily member 11-like isoform X3 [Hypanus sabinus]|uniref:immunoglobulin superfamily member 11-like isoform X3 n=1 Tax=Hypanus sabinus TaxID=79690 RepID=UPI0028C45BE1|nr:immunoglobulin superfamily member 11-like isoform X3 [Hypanus sabinus]XP_059805837.1 immunoglobulin superfamily member 11-like isoform X3 [Hypanus sabinus]